MARVFDVIRTFEEASGSKLKLTKTEGVYVGQQSGWEHGPVPIKWKADNIRALGTNIGNSMQQDWDIAIGKTENTLKRWSGRQL